MNFIKKLLKKIIDIKPKKANNYCFQNKCIDKLSSESVIYRTQRLPRN